MFPHSWPLALLNAICLPPQVGDTLARVDMVDVSRMRLKDLAPLLLGPEGSLVKVTLQEQDGTENEVSVSWSAASV